MSVDLNLNQITFQSSIRSKPVRENFTDIENAVNDLQSQINTLATPPAGTEVTNARDNHSVLRDRLRSASQAQGNVLISGGVVSEQASPDMTVKITAGEALVDGVACKWAEQSSGTITAPGSNTRLDYVCVNSDNSISIVAGTAAASPVFPDVASSQLIVAALVVKAATTSMNDGAEIFNFKDANNPYYPNVYVNSDTTLSANLNYNNLIIDGVKFDTATFAAQCQGYAHIVAITNGGANGTSESAILQGAMAKTDGTQWTLQNAGGKSLNGTGGPYAGGATPGNDAWIGGSGASGYSLKVRAFCIYVNGSCDFTGGDGIAGTTNANPTAGGWLSGEGGVGASGGNGGNGGVVTFEAIKECVINTDAIVSTSGGNGANGNSVSSGSIGNLGGDGGNAGNGGAITLNGNTIANNGTLTSTAGSVGTAGTGSGGSNANANGDAGSAGSNGTQTTDVYTMSAARPATYADWFSKLN